MFTGIILKTGIVKKIKSVKGGLRIFVKSKLNLSKKDVGSSINCSGVCLTLEKINADLLSFYISKETLKVSNFKNIKLNQILNLEKSLKFGNLVSGHFVQGHVDTTSILKKKKAYGKTWYLYFSLNKILKKFLIYKGSISLNGVSLTIAKILPRYFLIAVIPHTISSTNLKNIKINDLLNVEIDIIAKYMQKMNK